ncbi:hypothetical protein LJR219_002673 [Phenylobacterium sp. LjRoot219]|uniref:hypothetical protein n=1 Tax=Phenylobacterium sp. LjRoot219 TaxID=3342283 RepID=UPI003ECD3BD2
MKFHVLGYLERHHTALLEFWTKGTPCDATVEEHCDVVYSLCLGGELSRIEGSAPKQFVEILQRHGLPGWRGRGEASVLSVHNCAYAFGALNILREQFGDLYGAALNGRAMDFGQIIHKGRGLPRYPRWLAHHNWRVSHWIGGAPSILWSLAHSGTQYATELKELAPRVLANSDSYLDARTGLIKLYQVDAFQKLFRLLYGVRHDPDLGDVGGVAHILWVNHAADRKYLAGEALLRKASQLFRAHKPFMESVPYCLDFDVVQIVRTASQQLGGFASEDVRRAAEMMAAIEEFFAVSLDEGYRMHKLPGALATYHECALITGAPAADLAPVGIDIIKKAYWL